MAILVNTSKNQESSDETVPIQMRPRVWAACVCFRLYDWDFNRCFYMTVIYLVLFQYDSTLTHPRTNVSCLTVLIRKTVAIRAITDDNVVEERQRTCVTMMGALACILVR